MSDLDFAVQTRLIEPDAVVSIRGELTAINAPVATGALEQAMIDGPNLILLDLTDMEHIGSTAIPVMIGLISAAAANGRRLRAYGLREHHREIFELTKLSHHIDLYLDERSALNEGVGA